MFANSAPEDICVVRLSAIGDACHALAVVRNLQDNWPDAGITWILGKTEASLLADIPGIKFIIFDKTKGLRAYRNVHKALTSRRYDVALCMHASMRANLLCRLIHAPIKLGYDKRRARDFQWLFTNQRIPAVTEEHALDAMMGFARAIGAQASMLRWDIPISDVDRAFAAQHVGDRSIVISPCSSQRSRNFRNWSAENYAAVINHATERGLNVVLTGGSTELERDYGERIAAHTRQESVNLIGRTSLKQSLAVFAAATALICPDSGPAHMATAVDTPVIGLFASSNPKRSGPYRNRELCVDRYPEAVQRFLGRPVEALRWGQRVRDPGAMDLIKIDDVCGKIDAIFG